MSTSLTSASSCRSSYKRRCDECFIQWTHELRKNHTCSVVMTTNLPLLTIPPSSRECTSWTWLGQQFVINICFFTCMGLGSQSASSPWAIPPRRASKRGESLRASPEGLPTMAREDITAALVWPSSPQPRSGCTWMGRNSVLEIIFLIFQQDVTSPHYTQDWQRQPWVIDLDWERYPRQYDSTRPLPPQHKSIQTC